MDAARRGVAQCSKSPSRRLQMPRRIADDQAALPPRPNTPWPCPTLRPAPKARPRPGSRRCRPAAHRRRSWPTVTAPGPRPASAAASARGCGSCSSSTTRRRRWRSSSTCTPSPAWRCTTSARRCRGAGWPTSRRRTGSRRSAWSYAARAGAWRWQRSTSSSCRWLPGRRCGCTRPTSTPRPASARPSPASCSARAASARCWSATCPGMRWPPRCSRCTMRSRRAPGATASCC